MFYGFCFHTNKLQKPVKGGKQASFLVFFSQKPKPHLLASRVIVICILMPFESVVNHFKFKCYKMKENVFGFYVINSIILF